MVGMRRRKPRRLSRRCMNTLAKSRVRRVFLHRFACCGGRAGSAGTGAVLCGGSLLELAVRARPRDCL